MFPRNLNLGAVYLTVAKYRKIAMSQKACLPPKLRRLSAWTESGWTLTHVDSLTRLIWVQAV